MSSYETDADCIAEEEARRDGLDAENDRLSVENERLRVLLEIMAPPGCDCELCTEHHDEIKAALGR